MSFKPISIIFLILLLSHVGSAALYQVGSLDPVRVNQESWTCVDHAINYARENPECGVVSVSTNPNFHGQSHMVNYKVDHGTLILTDVSHANISLTWEFEGGVDVRRGYDYDYTYYHFWQRNETPLRNYRLLKDNLNEWYGVNVA